FDRGVLRDTGISRRGIDQKTQTIAREGIVFDDCHPNRRSRLHSGLRHCSAKHDVTATAYSCHGYRSGTITVMRVPWFGAQAISKRPPRRLARLSMLARPWPRPPFTENPRPLSWTAAVRRLPESSSERRAMEHDEWRTTLAMASL